MSAALVGTALLVAACGEASSSSETAATSRSAASTALPSSTATATPTIPDCHNPDGGYCLGRLAAGNYHTTYMHPQITYTVAAGWKNFEDLPGNFLLVPPRGNLPGVNAGTSDFIGIYTAVAAPNGCRPGQNASVRRTPAGVFGWIGRSPAFAPFLTRPATVGGLHGLVADLRTAPGWRGTCPYSNGVPVAPMITGAYPSGLDHNVIPGQVTRLYLLAFHGGALAIEVVDIHDAGHLAAYTRLVHRLRFGSAGAAG